MDSRVFEWEGVWVFGEIIEFVGFPVVGVGLVVEFFTAVAFSSATGAMGGEGLLEDFEFSLGRVFHVYQDLYGGSWRRFRMSSIAQRVAVEMPS